MTRYYRRSSCALWRIGGVGEKATTWVCLQGEKRKEKDWGRHNGSEAFLSLSFFFFPFQKRALETLSDPAVSHTMNCKHPGVWREREGYYPGPAKELCPVGSSNVSPQGNLFCSTRSGRFSQSSFSVVVRSVPLYLVQRTQ